MQGRGPTVAEQESRLEALVSGNGLGRFIIVGVVSLQELGPRRPSEPCRHVGLPLSLAFVDAGLRVGIYDLSQPALDRIAAGEMPFLESGADEILPGVLASGRLEMTTDGSIHDLWLCAFTVGSMRS